MEYILPLTRENFGIYKRGTYTVEGKEKDNFAYKTVITLRTKDGHKYRGEAQISKEDAAYYSSLVGFNIAEYRAYITYLKSRLQSLKMTKLKQETLIEHFSMNFTNKELHQMKHQIVEFKKAIKNVKHQIALTFMRINVLVVNVWKVKNKLKDRFGQINKI